MEQGKARNEYRFKYHPISLWLIIRKSLHALHEWNVAYQLHFHPHNPGRPVEKWTAAPHDKVKLNFDGWIQPQLQLAGIGGIVRDNKGTMLVAYTEQIQYCHPFEAELRALAKGVHLRKHQGCEQVVIEGGNFILLNALQSQEGLPWKMMTI